MFAIGGVAKQIISDLKSAGDSQFQHVRRSPGHQEIPRPGIQGPAEAHSQIWAISTAQIWECPIHRSQTAESVCALEKPENRQMVRVQVLTPQAGRTCKKGESSRATPPSPTWPKEYYTH